MKEVTVSFIASLWSFCCHDAVIYFFFSFKIVKTIKTLRIFKMATILFKSFALKRYIWRCDEIHFKNFEYIHVNVKSTVMVKFCDTNDNSGWWPEKFSVRLRPFKNSVQPNTPMVQLVWPLAFWCQSLMEKCKFVKSFFRLSVWHTKRQYNEFIGHFEINTMLTLKLI